MPSRKSDSTKNVSMAQFVYDGSDADISSTSLRPSSVPIASRSKPTPSLEMDAQRPTEAASGPDKDKDKKEPKEKDTKDTITIEDLSLPKSIITRLAKGVLPPNTQIQANAVLAMSRSTIVFINHLANAANEHTRDANKKTIMPADVFDALDDIEFPFFRERLEAEFKKFNETQTTKRNTYRRKVAAAKRAEKAAKVDAAVESYMAANPNPAEADTSSSAPRASKKQKPSAPDDSAMDVDADETRDDSDADTEPEQEHEEEEEEENVAEEEEEEENDEERDEHDRLEDREPRDDHDDALDDGDSD